MNVEERPEGRPPSAPQLDALQSTPHPPADADERCLLCRLAEMLEQRRREALEAGCWDAYVAAANDLVDLNGRRGER